jgi:cytoskeletal protein CcmA (bactofilin family)
MLFGSDKNRRRRELTELLDDNLVGLLLPGVDFDGKMSFTSGMIRLDSHCKGEITCEGTIMVGNQGEVEADIHTRIISIAGKVKGTVHASERMEIKEHGLFLGDMYTPCLVVDPGGFFDGQCHMPAPEPEPEKQPPQNISDKKQP